MAGLPMHTTIKTPNGILNRIFPTVNKWARSSVKLGMLYFAMIAVVSDAYFWMMKTNQMTSYQVKTTTFGIFGYFWHTFALPAMINLLVAFRVFSHEKDSRSVSFILYFI